MAEEEIIECEKGRKLAKERSKEISIDKRYSEQSFGYRQHRNFRKRSKRTKIEENCGLELSEDSSKEV